jgi:hypothetical protein
LIIYTSYLDVWDVRRDRIFDKRQSTIDIDTWMTWYLFITRHLITLTWLRFPIHPQTRCTMPPRYPRHKQLVWNIVLHLLNTIIIFIIDDDYWLIFNACTRNLEK